MFVDLGDKIRSANIEKVTGSEWNQERDIKRDDIMERDEEMGRFNLGGSTIIVLFGPDCVKWEGELSTETRVNFGQSLGHVLRTN